MKKFLKHFSDFVTERKESIKIKASGLQFMTQERQFKLFFYGIDGYITGNPNKFQRLAFNSVVRNVVDKQSTCDDAGFEGMKIRKRCKVVGKENPISEQSINWLKNELKPYFEDSLQKQLNLSLEILGVINEDEAKKAFEVYQEQEASKKKFSK
jgi:hypothetical protein